MALEIDWQVIAAVVAIVLSLFGLTFAFSKFLIRINRYKEQHDKMWEWFPSVLKKIIGETVEAEIISGNLQKQSPIQTTVVAENLIPEDAKLLLKSFAKENCCEGNTKQLDFLNLAHNVKIFLGREWGDSNISHHSNVNKIEEIAFVLYCAAFVSKLMRLETDRIA